ncbi:hypothetical protein [Streptomyces sp. KR55]|uniref:hypothetical protein n=1 Tax=Streptomyces sp. KR55 TaxID=3457425 RepID=UPI003FD03BD4
MLDQLAAAVGRKLGSGQQVLEGGSLGGPDRQVCGGDDAVGASGGLAPVDERASMLLGDDGVLEAFGTDGVGVIQRAVIELAEADREVDMTQEVVLDPEISALGLMVGA